MKNLLFISVLIYTLFSCTKDDGFDIEQYPQKWQLVKMTGQMPNSETTGADMEWQEFYLLNSDGSFTKSRERSDLLTEVSGAFTFKDSSEGKFLMLSYESDNTIIGNCSSKPFESLWLKSENKMMGTWLICDGPGLEYKRVK